jgi:hypothetical protein
MSQTISNSPDVLKNSMIRDINGISVTARKKDAYINATQLCKVCRKSFIDYKKLKSTDNCLQEVSKKYSCTINTLIRTTTGSNNDRITWINPYIAVDLAYWFGPKIFNDINMWIMEIIHSADVTKRERSYEETIKIYKNEISQLKKENIELLSMNRILADLSDKIRYRYRHIFSLSKFTKRKNHLKMLSFI